MLYSHSMEAKDLMIGDWVCITQSIWHTGSIQKVLDIYENGSIRTSHISPVLKDNYVPVPLTTEIIESNMFMCLADSFYNEFLPFEIKLCKERDNKSYMVGQEGDIIYYCCYVHTLQHILRDFGLDKIADNFKIQ